MTEPRGQILGAACPSGVAAALEVVDLPQDGAAHHQRDLASRAYVGPSDFGWISVLQEEVGIGKEDQQRLGAP